MKTVGEENLPRGVGGGFTGTGYTRLFTQNNDVDVGKRDWAPGESSKYFQRFVGDWRK